MPPPQRECSAQEFCLLTTFSFDLGLIPFVWHMRKKRQARSSSSSFALLTFWDLRGGSNFFPGLSGSFYLFQVISQEGQECNYLLGAENIRGLHCVCLIIECLVPACQPPCLLPLTSIYRDAKGPHLIFLTKMSTALSYACVVEIRESHVKQSGPFTLGLPAHIFIFNSAKLWSLY